VAGNEEPTMIDRAWRTSAALVATTCCLGGAALAMNDSVRAKVSSTSVGSWFTNDEAGSVSHVGPAGTDGTVVLDNANGPLNLVQIDGVAYVTDDSGRLTRIDPAQLDVSHEVLLPTSNTQIVEGGGRLFSVNLDDKIVVERDGFSLEPLGEAVQLDGTLGLAVVDDSAALWIPDFGTGTVLRVANGAVQPTNKIAEPGVRIRLAVVGGRVVAIDPTTARIIVIGGVGNGDSVSLPVPAADDVSAPATVDEGDVLPVLSGQSLATVNLVSGVARRTQLNLPGHQLGVPRVAGNRILIPDYTAGTIVVVSVSSGAIIDTIVVTGRPGDFDLIVDGGRVFVNDPTSEQAWSITEGGTAIPVTKYDPDAPGGNGSGTQVVPPQPPTQTSDPDDDSDPGDRTDDPDDPDDRDDPDDADDPDDPDGDGGTVSPPILVLPPPTTAPRPPAAPPTNNPPGNNPPNVPPTPPPAIQGDGVVPGVTATAGDATATVTWSAPTQWQRITGYEVVIQPGGTPRTIPADQRSHVERGLVNGTQYTFVVTALSNGTRGKSSMSNPVIPAVVVPGSPTITSVTGGNGQVTLGWQAPSGVTVNEYVLEAVPGGGGGAPGTSRVAGGQRSGTISGLTNGVTYTVDLRAITASGTSNTVTSPPVVPRAVPNAPTVSASITAPGQVTITWTVPAANGSTIGGYDVILVGGSTRREPASATQSVFTGLADGTTYSFRVVAVSDLGTSQPGLTSVDVQRNVPSAPSALSATPGDGAVTLTWTPATVAGTTIAEYRVLNLTTGVETTTTASSASVTNLANGTTYTFEVRAVAANSAIGPASSPAVATPAGAPVAPVISTATATGPTAGTISWSQQSPSNGTTVVEWRVTGPAGTQSVSSPTATVGGLVHNTTNTVTIVAVGANGTVSAAASATISTPSGTPGQVTGVGAWVDEFQLNGYVSWNAVAGADSYEIDPGNGRPLITVPAGTLNASFAGTGPVGATYTATVRAISIAFGAGPAGSALYTIPAPDPCLQQQPPRQVVCQ
jgi:hypothetical protein